MKDAPSPPPAFPRLLTDAELAPLIRVSVGFLQRDRRVEKRIPFMRVGDRCLYDPDQVLLALRALTIGGQAPRQRRKEAAAA